jgi:hypothetical protein
MGTTAQILWLDKYSPGWLVCNLYSNPALFVRETIAKDVNRASIELGAPREAKEHHVALAENQRVVDPASPRRDGHANTSIF